MRRLAILLTMTCIVLDQTKRGKGWLTTCQGDGEKDQVVFDQKIMAGQAVTFTPFIAHPDEFIHGHVFDIADAPPRKAKVEVSSDVGKEPN